MVALISKLLPDIINLVISIITMNKQEQIFSLLCMENQPDTSFDKLVYVIIYILTTVHYRW